VLEEEYARECINYHQRYLRDDNNLIDREVLLSVIRKFYQEIHLSLSDSEKEFLKNSVLDKNTIFLEVAHDGQLPHLGIIRLILKTYHLCTLIPNSMVLYFVGDHYSSNMCHESTLFGIPQMGVSPNKQRKPVVLKIGRKNQHVPLKWIDSPNKEMLDDLKKSILDWSTNNIAYEKKKGNIIGDLTSVRDNIDKIIDLLKENADNVNNYGNWLIRVQYTLLRSLMGDEINRIIFLPFSAMHELAKNEFSYYVEQTESINSIKLDLI